LDRESLRNIRHGIAREVHALSNKVLLPRTADEFKDSLYSLWLKGVETNHHPGMVRIIIEQRCGLTWRDLVDQLTRLLVVDYQITTAPDEVRGIILKLHERGDERYEHFDLVRRIVLTECRKSWVALVEELTISLIELWEANDSNEIGVSALKSIHEIGKDSKSCNAVVRDMVQLKTGLRWAEVELRAQVGPRGVFGRL